MQTFDPPKQYYLFLLKISLSELWIFNGNFLFPLTLHILIQTVIQPKFLNCIRICQKRLIIDWTTKAPKTCKLIASQHFLASQVLVFLIVTYSFWLLNQLFWFLRNNFRVLHKLFFNQQPIFKSPFPQKLTNKSILNSNLSVTINQPKFKKIRIHQKNCKNNWTVSS